MRFLNIILISGALLAPVISHADDKSQLATIQKSIAEQERKLEQQRKQRIALVEELKKQETAIAKLLGSIQQTQTELKKLSQDVSVLSKQIEELEAKQVLQQAALSKQLESAFRLGKNSGMELVFNGAESERNERIITYFGYFNEARQEQIAELQETHDKLEQSQQALQEKLAAQQALQTKQKEEQSHLEQNQRERQKTISSLDTSMQVGQQKLEELRENEAKLQAQLANAARQARALAEQEARQAEQIRSRQQVSNYKPTADERSLMARVSGIGKPQNQLLWPVNGKVEHRFGESLQGELHWKALVIGAKEGTEVKAIAEGKVILASWLQGYGFMVALDHGKGDMSLYGYNQRVLVNVGDNIKAGQPIALVGSSGGQGKPSLYFEIRRDGRALDPQAWLKK
ncbi:murein hydrolase activator EnvC [Zophobihabitans entericus]|uniref:Murein hydrolase activator EnvC n=2 Tax=Zophobihabitans entericus TaxID=1635327 RepID=A0A6G9IDM7_9GAMM|nr:murein hydrolase activator EnvC [Zophobihabitans entericus]